MLAFRPDIITSFDVMIYCMMELSIMCSATLLLVFPVFFKLVIKGSYLAKHTLTLMKGYR